ncbi:MAG TPA: CPBP family intramembrane glutamic endopeptidase [Candidatus Aquicultor sp.]
MIDKKPVFTYLAITFLITWGIEAVLITNGISFIGYPPQYAQLVVAGVMLIPALAALITARVYREKVVPYGWHIGPIKPYIFILIAMPLIYAVVYALTVLLGVGTFDLGLKTFISDVQKTAGGQKLPPFNPAQVTAVLLLISVFVSPFFNSLVALGEEIGWRGFLLPRLMPLGKVKAYSLMGVIWGLWHAPLVIMGFGYPGYPVLGIFMFIIFTTLIGIIINELTLKYKSVILAGWIHGTFNSQSYGIWRLIVVNTQPLLGGIAGLIGFVMLGAIAYFIMRFNGYREPTAVTEPASA